MRRYYITDRKSAGGFDALFEIIRRQMQLGVEYIQIREKDVAARQLYLFAMAVVAIKNPGTKILINSRADVALASGCDGVHLPANAPTQTLPGLIVGRSCHSLAEVAASQAAFVTFGPVFRSPGKGEPVGLDELRKASRLGKPVFALGGIDSENAAHCIEAGAWGIAAIRLFQDLEQ